MYFLRDLRNEDGEYDYKLYVISFIIFAVNTMIDLTRATSVAAFMARVSDESIGGTYMTFLTTLGNLGKLQIFYFKNHLDCMQIRFSKRWQVSGNGSTLYYKLANYKILCAGSSCLTFK